MEITKTKKIIRKSTKKLTPATLSAKEQFALLYVYDQTNAIGLKYEHEILKKYWNLFYRDEETTFSNIYWRLNKVIKNLVNENVLDSRVIRLEGIHTKSGKPGNYKVYTINKTWKSNNSTEFKNMLFRSFRI